MSVSEVIARQDLQSQIVAVHGILFLGEGCSDNEFLLLPKSGPFDGVGPIPMPKSLDRTKSLLIEEVQLDQQLGGSSVAGAYSYKLDALVIGEFSRHEGTDHPYRLGSLLLLLVQDYTDYTPYGQNWINRRLKVITFSGNRMPQSTWQGFRGDSDANPLVTITELRRATDPVRGKA
jgi:hypothetical protein